MKQRTRKALGILFCVLFLTLYCLAVMVGASAYMVGAHPALQLAFFIAAGLAWLPGVMMLIGWMNKP
jgi:hypothetical protein